MKIKEGGGMDIQKEREVFEAWVGSNGRSIERFSDGSYKSMTLDKEWEAWQAAKAQAVPEGFVLVPKEPTDAMLFAASGRDIVAEHYGGENILWPELRETWKAMIEAQEPAND